MKRFISIMTAVIMCLCLVVPSALAADGLDSLASVLDGVDISSLSDAELTSILDGLDLQGVDLDALKESLGSSIGEDDSDKLGELSSALSSLTEVPAEGSAISADSSLSNLSGLFGGVDMSWLPDVVSDPSGITSMFTDVSAGSGFDTSAIMSMISDAFGLSGLDLSALTSGVDLGSFDISGLFGGGDAASGMTDIVASITDGLKGGLESMGLDTSFLDSMMDNDIVNFFANLFIGLGDVINPSGSSSSSSSSSASSDSSSDYSGSYSSTPVTPKTGDTAAVLVAIGTISVAAAAAFVCLMKKE